MTILGFDFIDVTWSLHLFFCSLLGRNPEAELCLSYGMSKIHLETNSEFPDFWVGIILLPPL